MPTARRLQDTLCRCGVRLRGKRATIIRFLGRSVLKDYAKRVRRRFCWGYGRNMIFRFGMSGVRDVRYCDGVLRARTSRVVSARPVAIIG